MFPVCRKQYFLSIPISCSPRSLTFLSHNSDTQLKFLHGNHFGSLQSSVPVIPRAALRLPGLRAGCGGSAGLSPGRGCRRGGCSSPTPPGEQPHGRSQPPRCPCRGDTGTAAGRVAPCPLPARSRCGKAPGAARPPAGLPRERTGGEKRSARSFWIPGQPDPWEAGRRSLKVVGDR